MKKEFIKKVSEKLESNDVINALVKASNDSNLFKERLLFYQKTLEVDLFLKVFESLTRRHGLTQKENIKQILKEVYNDSVKKNLPGLIF